MLYDSRNQAAIKRLHPILAKKVQLIVEEAEKSGLEILITDGYRSHAEQTRLYNQGRTTKGKIVTNAKAGQSLHNYGLAIDIVPVLKNKSLDYSDYGTYELFASIAKQHDIEWGGNWTPFKDIPHFEYTEGHDWSYFANGGKLKEENEAWIQTILEIAKQKGITTDMNTKVGDLPLYHVTAVLLKLLS